MRPCRSASARKSDGGGVGVGLDVDVDVPRVDRLAQVGEQGEAGVRGGVRARRPAAAVVVDLGAALLDLRPVHGAVGAAQQGRHVLAVQRGQRDPDRGAHPHLDVLDEDRRAEDLVHPARDEQRVVHVVRLREQDGELVATEAGHGRRRRGRRDERLRDVDEQDVPVVVAQGVVDLLEAVEVDEQHREAGDAARGDLVQALLDRVAELRAVGEPGEDVVQRLVLHAVQEAALGEREAGLVRDGLQGGDVVHLEGAHLPHPLGDHERAEHPRLVPERDDDRLPVAERRELVGVRGGLLRRAALRGEHRVPAEQDGVPEGRVRPVVHLVAAHDGRTRREGPPARELPRFVPEEHDLGGLGLEQAAGAEQGAREDLVGGVRAGHRAAEVVELGQAHVAVVEGGVGAVGDEDRGADDEQQRCRARVRVQRGHDEDAGAGDDGRDDGVADEGGDDLGALHPPLVEADDGEHEQPVRGAGHRDPRRRGEPADRAVRGRGVRPGDGVEDDESR
jgi:hypothetical protein